MQAKVWESDPGQTVYDVASLPALISQTLATRRFHVILIACFAATALLLAAIGVHGVIGFTTAERRREIGLRVALGADARQVVRLIVLQGIAMTVPAVAVGLGAALLVTRFLRTMLYGVDPLDPATFITVCGVVIVVAAIAAYLPARRAAAMDPGTVVREG